MRKIISNMCQTVPAQQMKCVVLTVFFHAHWVYCVCRSRVCFCVQIWLWVLNHLWSSTPAQVFISRIWEISLHREQKAAALWPCVGWYLSQHSGTQQKQKATLLWRLSCSNSTEKHKCFFPRLFPISHCHAHSFSLYNLLLTWFNFFKSSSWWNNDAVKHSGL